MKNKKTINFTVMATMEGSVEVDPDDTRTDEEIVLEMMGDVSLKYAGTDDETVIIV